MYLQTDLAHRSLRICAIFHSYITQLQVSLLLKPDYARPIKYGPIRTHNNPTHQLYNCTGRITEEHVQTETAHRRLRMCANWTKVIFFFKDKYNLHTAGTPASLQICAVGSEIFPFVHITSNSNTMVCLPVREDNARALASGLYPVQVDKPWHAYLFYTTLNSVDISRCEVFRAGVCDFWLGWHK